MPLFKLVFSLSVSFALFVVLNVTPLPVLILLRMPSSDVGLFLTPETELLRVNFCAVEEELEIFGSDPDLLWLQ